MIRVDGINYLWMGAPEKSPPAATQIAFEYTSNKSIFTFSVDGKVEMNVTFLSPLTASDQKRQSLVFSYLDVVVQAMDGANHDVQLYTDISAGEYHWFRMNFECRLKVLQSGWLEITALLHNGTTEPRLRALRTTKFIDRPSFYSAKRTIKLTEAIGTGRLKVSQI
jgi:hypothetical protein